MKRVAILGAVALCTVVGLPARPDAADCNAPGDVQFVCGQAGPEDLAVVPGAEWVIAGGDTGEDGALRLIKVSDRTTTILFPTEWALNYFVRQQKDILLSDVPFTSAAAAAAAEVRASS